VDHACGDCRPVLPGARSVELSSSACSGLCYVLDRADRSTSTTTSSNLPYVRIYLCVHFHLLLVLMLKTSSFFLLNGIIPPGVIISGVHHSTVPILRASFRRAATFARLCFLVSEQCCGRQEVSFLKVISTGRSLTYPSTRPCGRMEKMLRAVCELKDKLRWFRW
jgi:hypothetical protein